jgi:uncharacterized protein DUF3854
VNTDDGLHGTAELQNEDTLRQAAEKRIHAPYGPGLLEHHADLLKDSAISSEVAAVRGYRSVTKKSELRELGFSPAQCLVPALLIPIWSTTGEIVLYQARPDRPRIRDGRPVKYETQTGARIALDVPPPIRFQLGNPRVPLLITEGVRKADSAVSKGMCCVALLGVWNFRGSNEYRGKVVLADWEYVALNGRIAYIVFDSDVTTKPEVRGALVRLRNLLEGRGAHVNIVRLSPGPNGIKVGLDDFIAGGHEFEDLVALASASVPSLEAASENEREGRYRANQEGLFWMKPTRDGSTPVQLTNFNAKIVAQIVEDDGIEVRRLLEIDASLGNRTTRFLVPVPQFNSMIWPIEFLGARAVVSAGFGCKEHARAAIQSCSGEIPERRVYTHTGWRKCGEKWLYLHAGGGIGPDGAELEVEVRLPDALSRFQLPPPPERGALITAVRASMSLLELGPDRVMVPLFAAIWQAVLIHSDFSVHLVGPTGVWKTELAALIQQHWGTELDARHLPASWLSTGNFLERLAAIARDTIVVVDDFACAGGHREVRYAHHQADRLLRAQGNRAGRHRLGPDARFREGRPPGGIILTTGEDIPRGHSLRSRLLILEIGPGELSGTTLSRCQEDAASGQYARALSGFIRSVALSYEGIQASWRNELSTLRQRATSDSQHRRTPDIVAKLAFGIGRFMAFAEELGVLGADEAESLSHRCWNALGEASSRQVQYQLAAEPTMRFIELLRAALASGRAHVADPEGQAPARTKTWGWRMERGEWRPLGSCVGWVDSDDLYLEPEAAIAAIQGIAREGEEGISITGKTLHKRLSERGLLKSIDTVRGTLTVRRVLQGARRGVLHLRAATILPEESDHSDQKPEAT